MFNKSVRKIMEELMNVATYVYLKGEAIFCVARCPQGGELPVIVTDMQPEDVAGLVGDKYRVCCDSVKEDRTYSLCYQEDDEKYYVKVYRATSKWPALR